MKASTLHIKKPSKSLLNLVRKIRDDKEANKKRVQENMDKYFKNATIVYI
jgi:hypothetical protein